MNTDKLLKWIESEAELRDGSIPSGVLKREILSLIDESKPEKSIEECKDEVAKQYGKSEKRYNDWREMQDYLSNGSETDRMALMFRFDEAMQFYASSNQISQGEIRKDKIKELISRFIREEHGLSIEDFVDDNIPQPTPSKQFPVKELLSDDGINKLAEKYYREESERPFNVGLIQGMKILKEKILSLQENNEVNTQPLKGVQEFEQEELDLYKQHTGEYPHPESYMRVIIKEMASLKLSEQSKQK